ncbi:LpqB family beta-propeller domain-containing protein [Gordonia hydrophobica]|uniref:LpqB family beta-propeller domain-containing protein n=1 Tax=Gordonia hydrophobica TaxID=40516 RepID=A0ABZ2TWZ9_9ACTN|nr:LpqB family beta-propeller domain-containing protein [Gordonia hydrophobica]MBM7366175.1 hypothetical protein [Gordonia hydrophobica]
MRRLVAALSLLLTAAMVLTGCVDIPESSSPQPIHAFDRKRPTNVVPSPRPDDDPETMARNFVKAMSDPTGGHRAARKFLTPQASQGWDDQGDMTVMRNVEITIDERTENAVRLRITGERTGELTSSGALRSAAGSIVLAVSLARIDGAWRINGDVPSGTVTDASQFLTAYRQVDLFYPDRTMTRLVADPRWLFGAEPDPSAVVNRLLAGPDSMLEGAVADGTVRGVSLLGPVTTTGNSIVVPLGDVSDADAKSRTALAAQIIWTLDDAGISGTYRIMADGAALVAGRSEGWRSADVSSFEPEPKRDQAPLHLVRDGVLTRLTGNRAVPVGGDFGGMRDITAAGISSDLSQAAVVVQRDGRSALMVGPYDGRAVEAADGATMTKPSYGAATDTGYVAVDGRPYQWIYDPATGSARSGPLDASAVTAIAPGPITAMQVSPDGVRVALIVGGRVLMAVISVNDRGVPSLTGVYELTPDLVGEAVGVAWSTAEILYITRRGEDTPVWRASIAGTQSYGLVSGNLKPPVVDIAASGTTVYVGDNRGVQQIGTGQVRPDQYWTAVGPEAGHGTVPVVPGR